MFSMREKCFGIALAFVGACSAAHMACAADGSSENAQRAIAESINAALQGDATRARKALSAVSASEFSGEDAGYRACMMARFGADSAPPVSSEYDPLVREMMVAYRHYWHRSLISPSQREALLAELKSRLTALAQLEKDGSWSETEEVLGRQLRAQGYYSQMGYTPPLRELMIWRKQESEARDVVLPEGVHHVRVERLDDFVTLGWSAYARCELRSNGGWVGSDRVFAVMPALAGADSADAFNASILGHETQHFADKQSFPNLENWELEYRAKLTELWMAKGRLPHLLQKFSSSQSDDKNSPHTYANKRVLLALRTRLAAEQLISAKPDLSDVPGDAVRSAAREVLISDSKSRTRAANAR